MRRAFVLDDRLSTLDVAAIYVKLALDPVPGQAFTIFVKPLRDKNRFVLQVSKDFTIARVKFLLQDKTGWPLNGIRLTSGLGSEYQDHETLENLNIVDGSEIKLLYKL